MKSGKSLMSVIGLIALESIMFVDLAIDLYTGEMTWIELCWILILCVLLAIPIVVFMRKRRKNR